MMKRVVLVLGVWSCCMAASGFVAQAAVPSVPPPSMVGKDEAIAKGLLSQDGYTPKVITRLGNGAQCVVFQQSAVTDYGDFVEDPYTPGTYLDDDQYFVLLSVNCRG